MLNPNMEQFQVVDKTFSPLMVNIIGTILAIVLFLAVVIPYSLLWHENPLVETGIVENGYLTRDIKILWILPIFFVSILIHEYLHIVGYRRGGAAKEAVKMGFQWKALMPYAHCKVPLAARDYKWAVALPGLIMGLLPAVLGIALHVDWLTLYGAAMLYGAVGDMLILWKLMPIQGDVLIQDHPTKPGFQILLERES